MIFISYIVYSQYLYDDDEPCNARVFKSIQGVVEGERGLGAGHICTDGFTERPIE